MKDNRAHPSVSLKSRASQAATGLTLAALIFGSWLSLHFFSMFVFDLSLASLPLAIAIAAVQCWLSVGLFIVSHDAMHGSLVPGSKRINSAIGATLLFLYAGFSWTKMRGAHFDHHRLAGKKGDPDFDENHPAAFWPWYATFLRRYFGPGSIVFVFSVVIIYGLVLDVPLGKIVLLYGAPAIASSIQLFYFGTFRPHHHVDGKGETFADRHNARSENFGTLASLASCFHFGYHHEHHCRPDTPWWALPKVRREVLNKGAAA
ncbi:fatty acid desaturase [Pontixanthobacter gangjinensis]|uniref:Beta-carotene ketolase n=1 Tax=Pontixanthobacter gangjinensis TaxID=1028742 RepID=A0A6I4SPL5_9SPHN|nr:fatty acid desaturase [Pontixanthobacter gangjinensis]MXO57753.1 beta-carotene ketolase [Pontixanthobacter gangjinensis]